MRTSAPDLPVAPDASPRRSRSRTFRTPSRVRWKAVLAPFTPPPTTTTSAAAMASPRLSVYSAVYPSHHRLRHGGNYGPGHATRATERGGRPRRRRRAARSARAARRGADRAEARARVGAGRRRLEVRPALQHLVERHPRVVQHLRQPDEPSPRRQAPPGAGDGLEAHGPDDVDLQAPPRREVAQRRP